MTTEDFNSLITIRFMIATSFIQSMHDQCSLSKSTRDSNKFPSSVEDLSLLINPNPLNSPQKQNKQKE